MDQWLEFTRGPLFRLCFVIMILGLLRILILDFIGAVKLYRSVADKTIPWKLVLSRTLQWLFPIKKIGRSRPVYSVISILFHIGLLIVPIFLFAHVKLWESSVGTSWITLPFAAAYVLTLSTVAFGLLLFLGRVFNKSSSFISRKQDYIWPLLLLIPFLTGFICAHLNISPAFYSFTMLIHILTGNMIFVLIPFTKIAHCVLMPFSQIINTLAWKFPPDTDKAICKTLNKEGVPV